MITALHGLIYAEDPDAARAFFRDVLRFPGADTGGGWLIFATGPSETRGPPVLVGSRRVNKGGTDQRFDLSLMCDDPAATRAELRSAARPSRARSTEERWGSTIQLRIPGAGTLMLYQPKYDPPALGHPDLESMW